MKRMQVLIGEDTSGGGWEGLSDCLHYAPSSPICPGRDPVRAKLLNGCCNDKFYLTHPTLFLS
jgi:hypothetical protein